MIEEDYVSYEVAKLLKEKGFEGECIAYYSKYKDNNLNLYRWRNRTTYVNVRNNGYTLVPTHQMAMKWLREVHNISIELFVDFGSGNEYWWSADIAYIKKDGLITTLSNYKSYEEACEAAIKYCLENLI